LLTPNVNVSETGDSPGIDVRFPWQSTRSKVAFGDGYGPITAIRRGSSIECFFVTKRMGIVTQADVRATCVVGKQIRAVNDHASIVWH
jgi:hypothetical protein